jgi:ADP-L-glycero-D-manno-heptose 6-epimerase
MTIRDLVVVTGGAGFIGSNLVEELGRRGQPVVVIDDFDGPEKWSNVSHTNVHALVNWTVALDWLDKHADLISAVFHLGAISSTTASDLNLLLAKNVHFSNAMWDWCARTGKPLLYGSSAATYGDGRLGFSDAMNLAQLEQLHPLNPYAWSKHLVDLRILRSVTAGAKQPPAWYGVKFFNVYGPREHHKGDMRSVALKFYEKATSGGDVELFRSHRPDVKDGMQLRDFIHVGDCIDVMLWLMAARPDNGIYNIGTGRAEPFLEIANAVIAATKAPAQVRFIDMPEAIRDRYQYFTAADMSKLRGAGYNGSFRPVAAGIADYVRTLSASNESDGNAQARDGKSGGSFNLTVNR